MSRRKQSRPIRVQDEQDVKNSGGNNNNNSGKNINKSSNNEDDNRNNPQTSQQDEKNVGDDSGGCIETDCTKNIYENQGIEFYSRIEETGFKISVKDQISVTENGQISINNTLICKTSEKTFVSTSSSENKSHQNLMSTTTNMCSEMQIKSQKNDDNLRDEKTDIKHVFPTNKIFNKDEEKVQIQETLISDKNNNDDDDGDDGDNNNNNDNNNDNDDNDDGGNSEIEDNGSQVSFDSSCALDLSMVSSHSIPPLGHVTFEALQNTKVAVAQFAATAIANSKNYDEAVKDLAMVQSTFFNLHRQQMLQMQLIHELQSQLLVNQKDVERPVGNENIEQDQYKKIEEKDNEEGKSIKDIKKISANCDVVNHGKLERKFLNSIPEKTKEKINEEKDKNRINIVENSDTKKEESTEYVSRPQLCHISSSLASSIITNHDPLPPPDEPNSLEMLQRRTQEVLNSASQGILATNLADEIALRKNSMSQDGSGKNEPFFKHRCKYCGKVFGSDSALQIHIRSHTGERPFECDVCASKFTTKGNLKVHYQRHTQRYPCGPIMGPGPEYLENYPFPHIPRIPIDQGPSHYSQQSTEKLVDFHPPVFNAFGNLNQIRPPFELPKYPEKPLENKRSVENEQEEPTDLSKPSKSSDSMTSNKVTNESKLLDEHKTNYQKPSGPVFQMNQNVPTPIMFPKHPLREVIKTSQISPENLSKEQPSSSSLSSASSEKSFASDTNSDLPPLSNMITNATQNDHSWENLIEIAKPSETSKLQQLVDNIENKLSDPNQCVFCQKILSCRSALQMHYRTHTGERPFRCRICGRAFATKGNLKAHMIIHKIKPPIRSQFKCPVCHNKFSNALTLQDHIRTHTKENFDNCQRKIQDQDYSSNGTDEKNFEQNCMIFERAFSENSEHKSDFSMDDYVNDDDDDDDIMEIDDDDDEEDEFNGNDNKRMASNICSIQNNVLNDRLKENKSVSTSISSSGDVDGALDLTPKSKIQTDNGENNTLNSIHNQNMNKYPTFLPFSSGSLGNSAVPVFPNSMTSYAHGVMHRMPFGSFGFTGIRGSTTCSVCYKTFACTSALEIHFRSHTKERPFKCSVCDRAFSTKKEERFHTTFNCANRNGNLKQHYLTHKHCEASANSSSTSDDESLSGPSSKSRKIYLSKDKNSPSMKSHQNDRPLFAPLPVSSPIDLVSSEDNTKKHDDEEEEVIQRKSIKQNSFNMDTSFSKQHIETYDSTINNTTNINLSNPPRPSSMTLRETPETSSSSFQSYHFKENSLSGNYSPTNSDPDSASMKHYCSICRKNFSSTSALQIHMRTHTGDKPFRCSICQKAFTTKGNLKVHMSTHMWTNGASRRGRRMSLEFPLGRPLPPSIGSHLSETEYLSRRTDMFHPYMPPILNGMQHQLSELRSLQPGSYPSFPPMSPNHVPGKYSGLFGFGPFMQNSQSTGGIHQFQVPSMGDISTRGQETTLNSLKDDSKLTEMKSPFWKVNFSESNKEFPGNQNQIPSSDNRTESVKV